MSIAYAEQLGFDAGCDGHRIPENFSEWLKNPGLLAAWYRGYNQSMNWS